MSSSLKILALEPYFDAGRRQVFTSMVTRSRHDWTLLTLPPRRVERRLAVASRWFAEQINRDALGPFDLLFVGEMLNLPDFRRCVPRLANVPAVIYFQENQTPPVHVESSDPLHFVNVNTAVAASELWFNSQWHLDDFLDRAEALVARQPEIGGRAPTSELRAKSQVVLPPTDLGRAYQAVANGPAVTRDPRTLLVDTRGIDTELLLECVRRLEASNEIFDLITVGPQRGIPDDLPRTVIHERDQTNQLRAAHAAGTYLSLRRGATFDEMLIPALSAGCWPVVPEVGIFPELIPTCVHDTCLHDGDPAGIVERILHGWHGVRPIGLEYEQEEILSSVDAVRACRIIDDMLEEVAAGRGIGMVHG